MNIKFNISAPSELTLMAKVGYSNMALPNLRSFTCTKNKNIYKRIANKTIYNKITLNQAIYYNPLLQITFLAISLDDWG